MSILQLSIYGSILISIVLLMRTLFVNKLPKWTFVFLWGICVLRLLLPFSIASPFSIYSALPENVNISSASTMSNVASHGSIASISHASSDFAINAAEKVSSSPINIWFILWIAGAVLMLMIFLTSYIRGIGQFRESLPFKNDFIDKWREENHSWLPYDIRISDKISSPLVYGILKPVILLPKNMKFNDETSLRCVLTHEVTHIKRLDMIKKNLMLLALCIHWFNPLVWLMCILANRDIEISCDERVINHIGSELKKSYALTLFNMVEKEKKSYAIYFGFSKYAVKERVVAIMKMKKSSILSIVFAVVLIFTTTAVFATSRESNGYITGEILDTEFYVSQATLKERGVELNFYYDNDELFLNYFHNIYKITSLKGVLPKFEGVYSVGFRFDYDLKHVESVRLNFDGDWLTEPEFAALYQGYTFDCFSPILKDYIQTFTARNVKVSSGYYVSREFYNERFENGKIKPQ